MRIIGGRLRGRRLEAPPGRGTRPMLDRVREALFSTLSPWFAGESGARVLDLYAGSGSLGLEALSRGATHVRMVERDARALAMLEANVDALGARAETTLVHSDALSPGAWGEPSSADVVFLDPPYPHVRDDARLRELLTGLHALVREVLAAEGVLVLHAPRGALRESSFAPDLVARERIYGTNSLWYLQRAEEG